MASSASEVSLHKDRVVIASEFVPYGRQLTPLEVLRTGRAIGPYELKVTLRIARPTQAPEACFGCRGPEKGCDRAEERLQYCYPNTLVDLGSYIQSIMKVLFAGETLALKRHQVCTLTVSKRYCGKDEEPGTEIDLLPLLDHVEVVDTPPA